MENRWWMFVGILASDGRRSATGREPCAGLLCLVCPRVCVYICVYICMYMCWSSLIIHMSSIHHTPWGWRQIRNRCNIPSPLLTPLFFRRQQNLPTHYLHVDIYRVVRCNKDDDAPLSKKKQISLPFWICTLCIILPYTLVGTPCQLEWKHIVCNRYY